MASSSSAKLAEDQASGSLGSPISFRNRRGSVASANSLVIEKEQLAFALDRIHTAASRADSLTTFNDFAPPPIPNSTSENKATAGEAVNQGFASLYSRFRDAVGAGGPAKKPQDEKDPETESTGRASRHSGTSLTRTDTAATTSTMMAPEPYSANDIPSGTIPSPTENRSQASQASKGSSINLMTGSKSQAPSRQSVPTNATSAVTADPPTLTKEESSRSRLTTQDSAEGSAQRSLSKVDLDARMAASDPTLYDKDGRLPPRAQRDDTSSLASIDTSKSPVHGSGPHLPPIQTRHHRTPSGGSVLLSPENTRRRPTAISRLGRSPSPGSRGSSTDRGTAAANPISIAANNSVYHESFSRNSNPQQRSPRNRHLGGASDHLAKLAEMRNQVLNKEFWMKDDTVKECHYCQASFSAFRRKHHCRTCGFIFDSKCTTVISGSKFGVQGTLRVCKRCLDFISRKLDGSGSDDSGDDQVPVFPKLLPGGHHKSPSTASRFRGKDLDVVAASEGSEDARPISTPMMAIPATRRVRDSNRSSAILEINSPQLSRPGSSRSLKSLASGRPQSSTGHKRQHSKHGFFGRFKERSEDQAPFRKGIDDDSKKSKYPAFHEDNIIDPELAEYMSADESSGDEQMGLFSAMSSSDIHSGSYENERNQFSGSYNASKKHRHRSGEKSISGISGRAAFDDVNGPASLLGHRRQTRRRNLSNVSGSVHHLPSSRPKSAVFKGPSASSEMLFSMDHQGHSHGLGHGPSTSQVTRSDSLQQRSAPKVELKGASLRHVYRILYQLLEDAGVHDPRPWQEALVPILLRATDDVDPDVPGGEDMDIRHYIKLKRIPGGKPGDTSYVSGVVFTKNLALKSMPRKISNPRIVLVRFPIEYHRHDTNLMSLQPVIEQEKEYLRVVVQRITNLRPNVLLAEKGVSGVALQYLNEANISVVYNVKHTVIEAVSRCAETEVITSLDMLALPVRVGRCSAFEVRTFVNNDYPGRKKSYIFISGCKPDLGCTISIRGANHTLLAKIKSVVEFMVYVVYNLKLESSLLKNESVEAPDSGENSLSNSILAVNDSFQSTSNTSVVGQTGPTVVVNDASTESEPPSQETMESSIVSPEGSQMPSQDSSGTQNEASKPTDLDNDREDEDQGSPVPDDVPMPTYYSDLVAKYETKILSASPYVKFAQPYLLMKAREQERRLIYLRRLVDHDQIERREAEEQEARERAAQEAAQADGSQRLAEEGRNEIHGEEATTEQGQLPEGTDITDMERIEESPPKAKAENDGSAAQRFQLIKPEMVEKIGQKAPKQMMEILHAVHDAEYDKAMFNYQTQTRHWETYIQGNLDLFDPYAHQNIVVLYSVICTETKIPCTEPGLVAFNFYNEQHYDSEINPDCTLGQYIEDLVYSKEEICDANGCERKMMGHHRTYVHDKSRITVFVEPLANPSARAAELGDGITMWTYCKICKKDSEETAMSESTYKYSFGKYLELLYWGRGLRMKDSVQCPHDHHKDHVRYFSLEDSRVRIHWDPIDLLEIVVPRARITWKVANDLKLKNDIYTKLEERWIKYMKSVNVRLKGIRIDSVLPEKAEYCREEVEQLTRKAQADESGIIRELQDIYVNTKYYEVVPFNKITRRMLEIASEWDMAFTKFEADYLGDKDMRQLTMLQLKKMFADNESKESLMSNEGSGSVGESDEPSQTFSEADEKSTQPTEFTENTSMETSVTSASRHEGVQPVTEGTKVSIPAEGALERVEPLDLAGSPVAIKNPGGEPQPTSGDNISKVPSPPKSPRPSPSPTGAGRATTDTAQSGQSLTERIDQKRQEQAAQAEQMSDGNSIASTDGARQERRAARRSGDKTSPPFSRAISQPARPMPRSQSSSGKANAIKQKAANEQQTEQQAPDGSIKVDKRLSERLGLSALKSRSKAGQSSIPRLVPKKRDSKVSTLAKHFEQLSREFERERIRDRKKRADSVRQPRAMLPRTATKAVVEVYDNLKEALDPHEKGTDKDGEKPPQDKAPVPPVAQEPPKPDQVEGPAETSKYDEGVGDSTKTETPATGQPSQTASDDDVGASDSEQAVPEEYMPDIKEIADSLEPSTEIPLELPKHQKTSLMKYLTNFWAERSASGWPTLDYPVTGNDHIFVDSDIIVREDEPSSVIALALNSGDYKDKLAQIRADAQAAAQAEAGSARESDAESVPVAGDGAKMKSKELEESMLRATATHLKYQFKDGASVMTCKVFYAEQFDALRRKCGVAERIVESLSRCLKWDSKGGKTKSVFLKTLDDRLVLKSLSPVETSAFLRFAPGYFSIMAEALFHDLPSVIAKMVGFFQVLIKNPITGVDVRLDLLVTENLFYDRSPTRIFDLKGSMRNRKIESTGEQNEVLLDENMVEFISESPLFAREHSKKLLRASVWNDTLFLARQNVMDYSLMIAVDEDRKELVVGIIDCIRTYTWDKKLESWIKDRGFAGGGRNRPTVTSPKEYKNRFREAMAR